MSTKYRDSADVPTDVIVARLRRLVGAITGGRESMDGEFTMRVPAECDRDADLVLAEAARRLEQADARVAELNEESLQAIANEVCGELPEGGWVINLCMENGAAWVEAIKPSGYTIDIDRSDISLAEQIGEAVRIANKAERAGGEQ